MKLSRRKRRKEQLPVQQYAVVVEYPTEVLGDVSTVHIFDTLPEARAFKQKFMFDKHISYDDCKVKILVLEDYRKEITRLC